jgi:tetratricopeptide (TPR) repeat protein
MKRNFIISLSILFFILLGIITFKALGIPGIFGKHAIRINSENANSYVNLGITYGKSGMYKEAVNALKQAIRVNPNNAEAHYNLGFAYLMLNDKNSALNEYEILRNLDIKFANKLYREIHKYLYLWASNT